MNFNRFHLSLIIVMGICFGLTSCGSKQLKDQRVQQEIEYTLEPGTQVNVTEGVVTFTGTFPDEESMKQTEATARGIKGVKSVVNKATLANKMQSAVDTTRMP